ncbi:arsenate reductase family protein [Paenibacillus methanolicus]|uniref:Arsenate reductase n=1 Tax=Paenibacillus methanolicus TaxID=582686 RepID=A0A5S5BU06_9BACL|nr:arsenate reductase family protein [Paenibacillus methanolicus]TYP69786.1 arsenate reductase [Paenibacillus methanolicus]
MSKLKLYEYSKCGTCRSALKWLKAAGYDDIEKHDVFETAPSAETIAELVARSGLDIKKFFNTSGEVYKELGLKDKLGAMTDEEKIALLASNGRLIKRPVVTDGSKVTVGFKEEHYEQEWKQ